MTVYPVTTPSAIVAVAVAWTAASEMLTTNVLVDVNVVPESSRPEIVPPVIVAVAVSLVTLALSVTVTTTLSEYPVPALSIVNVTSPASSATAVAEASTPSGAAIVIVGTALYPLPPVAEARATPPSERLTDGAAVTGAGASIVTVGAV